MKDLSTNKGNKNVEIHWYYDVDDDDMLDAGKKYAALLDLEFKYFSKDENQV